MRSPPRVGQLWRVVLGSLVVAVLLSACGSQPSPQKVYQLGLAALQAGQLSVGVERIEEALAAGPEASFAAEANNWLGLAYRDMGDGEKAKAAFERARELAPASADYIYNLGCLELEAGDPMRGITLLRQAADTSPKDTRALLQIGEWTTRNGRWDLAKRMYYEAKKRDSQNAAAVVGLGRIALLENKLPQAETLFMEALEVRKDYPPALYNLGVAHALMEGHGEQAQEYFRQYLLVAPKGDRAATAAARIGGQPVAQTSFTATAPERPRSAAGVAWVETQELLRKGEVEAAYLQAMRAVEIARESGDADQLAEVLRKALQEFPERATLKLAAGEFHARQGQPAEAKEVLLQAQALEPGNPMVLNELARVSAQLEEYDSMALVLKQLVDLEPHNPDALWLLADTYGDKLGMTGRGIALYRDFERRFPTDPRVAEVRARIKALEEAAADLPDWNS